MATKRSLHQDPEYDAIPEEVQEKRIKLIEDNVRKQTEKKIEAIIKSNFDQEIAKQHETIDSIDEVLHEARCMMDRLRACAVTKYYANLVQEQGPNEHGSSIHPTVKKYLSKTPRIYDGSQMGDSPSTSNGECHSFQFNNQIQQNQISTQATNVFLSPSKMDEVSTRAPRFKRKCKIIVGNVSRFIPAWQRDGSDRSTHKWMVYVRGDSSHPNIESFVKKVIFLLHPSYKPSDIVEISNPPFHLIKRGWGEFPVRVQLHFHDPRNKAVDIIHQLKLDKTYTGLQTLGAETVVEVQLFKPDESRMNSNSNSLFSKSGSVSASTETHSTFIVNGPTSIHSQPSSDSSGAGHSTIKKDSLVMNIKLPKTAAPSELSNLPTVNNHEGSSSSSDCTERGEVNSEKKTVPKIVISNNKITTISSSVKPNSVVNGLSTTVLKCKDYEGRVLLVPKSSLTLVPPSVSKPNAVSQVNSEVNSAGSNTENTVNRTVPSYILKLVSKQDSGVKQAYLIPLSDKKNSGSVNNSVSEPCNETLPKQDAQEKQDIIPNNISFIKKPHIHYEQELDSIKLDYFKSFTELLQRVCVIFPLVKKGVDRSVFTFCANSIEEFHTWNVGKQRASEWRRSGMVRKAIINLLKKKGSPHLNEDSVWSRSSIMSWCRKNGFVPMATEKVSLLPEPKWSGLELCSLTTPTSLMSSLPEESHHNLVTSDDEEIDVVDISDEKKIDNASPLPPEAVFLPNFSDCGVYVKQTASQLGVDIKPIEMEPNLYAPAIEEMIVSICRQLACDIIGSSLNEGFNRLGGKICPEEITVSDVYSAIVNNPKFDMFSNSNLGIPKNLPEST